MSLPSLPHRELPWSSNVYAANHLLRELYRTPTDLLASGNYNLHRIQIHRQSVLENAIPLLLEMKDAAADEGLPDDWLHDCADHFARLLIELGNGEATATGQYVVSLLHSCPS